LWTARRFWKGIFAPAGPLGDASAASVKKLLAQMTLKEKVGQMTQLEIGMVTDGTGARPADQSG